MEKAQALHPKIRTLTVSCYYLVTTHYAISENSQGKIAEWLGASVTNHPPSSNKTHIFWYVLPRPGTLSPWSSKAMDIAAQCQLSDLKHIELITGYTLNAITDTPPHATHEAIQSIFYDPLIETLTLEPLKVDTTQEITDENIKKHEVSRII